ncbi:MAG: RNA 2',3'-cyclic phosphodiesterase [Actinomycetota bacterium]
MTEVEHLRLFVAARVPQERLAVLERETRALRSSLPKARWIPTDNQHVTLKFLGRTPSDHLGEVRDVVAMAAAGRPRSECALGALGAFPSLRRARVLWAGLDDEAAVLEGLAADLSRAFEPLGFPEEARRFTPHLTLARFKVPERLEGRLPDVPDSPAFTVDRIELMRSRLHPKGARYETLSTFDLT